MLKEVRQANKKIIQRGKITNTYRLYFIVSASKVLNPNLLDC